MRRERERIARDRQAAIMKAQRPIDHVRGWRPALELLRANGFVDQADRFEAYLTAARNGAKLDRTLGFIGDRGGEQWWSAGASRNARRRFGKVHR